METVIEILTKALQVNLQYAILLDIIIGMLFLANIILGTIIGTYNEKFDAKKFLFGVVKSLIVMFIIVAVCYAINVFALTLEAMNTIKIDDGVISVVQILGILVGQGYDLLLEVIDKIKAFRTLKYISYDNVVISDSGLVEPDDLKG